MNPKRVTFLFLYSFAPLLAGTLIYLLWRSDSLVVFRWLDVIGLSDFVTEVRENVGISATDLPEWIRFSMPDGLWVFAATTALGAVWLEDWRVESTLWIALPLALACLVEIGQATGHIDGTFSAIDVAAYFAGSVLGWSAVRANRPGEGRK